MSYDFRADEPWPVELEAGVDDPRVADQLAAIHARRCPYFQYVTGNRGPGTCHGGCYEEPSCMDYGPPTDITDIEDRHLQHWVPGVHGTFDPRTIIAALCRTVQYLRNENSSLQADIRNREKRENT